MPREVWDELTYPFPDLSGATVKVWELISNFMTHCIKHSRLIPMYNARFILWPPSPSSPIRKNFFLNMGKERRWPRWIKKASHIGSKRLCFLNMGKERRWPRWIKKASHIGSKRLCFLNMGKERRWPRWIKKASHIGSKRLCINVPVNSVSKPIWSMATILVFRQACRFADGGYALFSTNTWKYYFYFFPIWKVANQWKVDTIYSLHRNLACWTLVFLVWTQLT